MPNVRSWYYRNQIPIMQQPVQQKLKGCAYAAVCGHLEYNMRDGFAFCYPSVTLPPVRIFDFEGFQDELDGRFPGHPPFTIPDLVYFAEVYGIPLWNGHRHFITGGHQLNPSPNAPPANVYTIADVTEALKDGPLIAVMYVHADYSEVGDKPYIGAGYQLLETHPPFTPITHAVVLVGEYEVEAQEALAWGVTSGTYFMYQNSESDNHNTLFPLGVSLVKPQLIKELYVGHSQRPRALYPVGPLQRFTF